MTGQSMSYRLSAITFSLLFFQILGCQAQQQSGTTPTNVPSAANNGETPNTSDAANSNSLKPTLLNTTQTTENKKMELATFGGGCFWCTEAVFQHLKGVKSVKSGYMGGHVENPTYEQVCDKKTGHAEVIHIEFDPSVIKFQNLLEVHWKTHDPTTLNKQGNDVGPQYRSAIFYHNDEQKEKSDAYKKKLNEDNVFGKPVVTEITKASTFWPAEDYHQNYFKNNPSNGYCQMMIPAKIAKLKKAFGDLVKEEK